MSERFVLLRRVESRPEALVIQGVLETAGIPVVVRTPDKYLLLQGDWSGSPKPPPVEIWVGRERKVEAEELLKSSSEGNDDTEPQI
jgi:hypothetical protein